MLAVWVRDMRGLHRFIGLSVCGCRSQAKDHMTRSAALISEIKYTLRDLWCFFWWGAAADPERVF